MPHPSGCVSLEAPEEVAQASYQEFSITTVSCSTDMLEYESSPGEFWPLVRFRIYLKRASNYYALFAIVPSLALTILSFTVFFMNFQVGERLGVGVTLVLMIEVAKVTMSTLVPVCEELLWLEIFYLINFLFTFASLAESVIVLSLAFLETEKTLPAAFDYRVWASIFHIPTLWKELKAARIAEKEKQRQKELNAPAARGESMASSLLRKKRQSPYSPGTPSGSPIPFPGEVRDPEPIDGTASRDADDVSKLIFFENLFFKLDVDGSSTISFDEMRRMLSFTALDMTSAEVEEALRSADNENADGELDRHEFIDLCMKHMGGMAMDQLESAATNYAEFRLARQRRTNAKWRRIATRIDEYSRFWFPALYVLAMFMINRLELEDRYAGKEEDGTFLMQRPLLDAMVLIDPNNTMLVFPILFVFVTVLPMMLLECLLIPARKRLNIKIKQDGITSVKKYAQRKLDKTLTLGHQNKVFPDPDTPASSTMVQEL